MEMESSCEHGIANVSVGVGLFPHKRVSDESDDVA